jgi:cell division transport system permease protein
MSKRASTKGASRSFSYLFNTWLIQHAQAFLFSLGQTGRNPVGSFLTIAVIGVSLSLPATFYLILNNASILTETWAGDIQISLFLDIEASQAEAQEMQRTLLLHGDVERVELVDKEQALDEYRSNSGFSSALNYLDENPLPYLLIVYPKENVISTDTGNELLEHLRGLDNIESAQFDRQWANRLFAILEILQRAIFVLSALLAFAVLLIIGNTIRLGIINQHAEIEINKLFGATDAFIQRPFLYSGFIHGLGGSLMAWMLIYVCVTLLASPIDQLSSLYNTTFKLTALGALETLLLLGIGAGLGLIGSGIAVKRHIKSMGPS